MKGQKINNKYREMLLRPRPIPNRKSYRILLRDKLRLNKLLSVISRPVTFRRKEKCIGVSNGMNFFKNHHNSKSGFSVIEVLVGIFILILMSLAVFLFQKDIFSLNKIISGGLTAQYEALRALKSMSAEIRTASPSSLGAYPLVQTATSSFTFYSNIDDDSFKEQVRYFLEGATLKKGAIKPSGIPLTYNPTDEVISELIHNVANATTSTFSYYDADYDGTTQPLTEPIDIAMVRLVKITIMIDKDPQTLPGPIVVTTQISMRNLKDNL